ncbi:G-type lectin S-receptor-like serine/threonine-protein kinase At4g27290 [Populus alba]|uniref:Receptor-like serine/threonine-protein kinase n=2 Tax=Populus TaxID=3689 RepID=A0AAD6RTF6_9ROSI|nr:G-type lectin S-receptor-like serine/threonine-protein kinase At4g27290 [Populus alba]KAJ7014820.1 G-type lectin S-receptor-like serine/threonine-protein kinase [Populus alba x Populus x berolinensis]
MERFRVVFVCIFLLISPVRISAISATLTPGQSIRDGETLVSAEGNFELGFFSPGSSNNRYLGIWYKQTTPGTSVWVANREKPIVDRLGVLNVTAQGVLVLFNSTNYAVWSSNVSRTAQNPVVQLLDSGNLAVKDGNDSNPDNFLWQSFDYPSETLLPGMKWGKNLVTGLDRYISPWKSSDDPARGDFAFRLDPRGRGYSQMLLMRGLAILFRTGTWNGFRWGGVPDTVSNTVYREQFVSTANESYYRFDLLNSSIPSRLVISPAGIPQRLTWIPQTNLWAPYSVVQIDQCDTYTLCGVNGICSINDQAVCSCLESFVPKTPDRWNSQDWSGGCVRRTQLGCNNGDGFLKHTGVKLPDMSDSWVNTSMSLNECGDMCLSNCSCVAYSNSDIRGGGSGCYLWFSELKDTKQLPQGGEDLYIRMAASELRSYEKKRSSSRRKLRRIIVGILIPSVVVLLLGLILFMRRRNPRRQAFTPSIRIENYKDESDRNDGMELPAFDFTTIEYATDCFSFKNKLGEGGFGSVYKGTLSDGQEIAVKRLSKDSGQGLTEFKNEVILIAKLQHRNLVKLLGCCIEGNERILIYEYMPNKSLDNFIFDQTNTNILDWQARLNIIGGIARGLLYLHQDSRLRIIHRDLKASNVLLDDSMNPKISDFGMARTFGGDQIEANTSRIVGTYGYMSPEYAVDGLFSIKSDVFSFGVLVLEIVSAKKNRGFFHPDHNHNLLGHAWRLWNEGRPLELMNKKIDDSSSLSEVIRCIQVGLLCVQQRPEDRPSMSTVVVMLSSEISLPQPKQPGFYTERSFSEQETSSSSIRSASRNNISFTVFEPR